MTEPGEATPVRDASRVRVATAASCTAAVPIEPAAASTAGAAVERGGRRG